MKVKLLRPNTNPEIVVIGEYGSCKIRLAELPASGVTYVTVEHTEGKIVVDELDSPSFIGERVGSE